MINARFPFSLILTVFLGIVLFDTTSGFAQSATTRITLPPAVTAKATPNASKHSSAPQGTLDVYDHGDPTAEEQYELEIINRARANPHAEGDLLYSTTDPFLVSNRNSWLGQSGAFAETPSQIRADFYTYPAQPPFAFNKDLIDAARIHSEDMLNDNYQAHVSPTDGSDPFQRMEKAGYTGYDNAAENIFSNGNDLDEINQEFEYDFGNSSLGHRTALINFTGPVYTEIGIGIIHGTGSGGVNGANDPVGPIITTEDFGHIPGNTFITGVVYGDDNSNKFYDVGEGLPGVTITASNGWTAVSSPQSGGYAIPITGPGNVTLTASGGLLTADIVHTVTVDNVNVKVDFVQGGTGLPDKVALISPVANGTADSTTVHFSWASVSGATQYEIQVSTKLGMLPILKDVTQTATTYTLIGLKADSTYYWQVRAKNANGWGLYSTVSSFTVNLPGAGLTLLTPANGANVGAGNDVHLTWKSVTPQPLQYAVNVSTTKSMANIIFTDTIGSASDLVSAADFLQPNTTYYWDVTYQTDKGWSSPSTVWDFITGTPTSVAETITNPFHSFASPNPAMGSTHIRFTLDNAYDVTLKIFDVAGKEESSLPLGKLSADNYDIIWNAIGKPAGVYIYELTAGDKREVGRIVLMK